VEIWADNISLQPFTKKQWRSLQDASIEKVKIMQNLTLIYMIDHLSLSSPTVSKLKHVIIKRNE